MCAKHGAWLCVCVCPSSSADAGASALVNALVAALLHCSVVARVVVTLSHRRFYSGKLRDCVCISICFMKSVPKIKSRC